MATKTSKSKSKASTAKSKKVAPIKKGAVKKVTVKKAPAKKAAARKSTAKKVAPSNRQSLAKKNLAKRKAPAKKAAAKKPVAKKPVTKKPVVKKAVKQTLVKKPVAQSKQSPAKTAVPKKAPITITAKTPAKALAPKEPPKLAPKVPAKPVKPSKPFSANKLGDYACGDYVVYPTHGVGQVVAIEERVIAGFTLRLFVISFDKEKMTLRVPVGKADEAGLRKLSTRQEIDVALTTLKGRSRVSRAMWSRRAQEYEAKINSGSPVSIAEVVRDLHRNAGQPDQSYSERQIYEAALERLARELAAVEKIGSAEATVKLEQVLVKVA
ncbi:MAG: CarD family transcriptional regulator [Alphaproteobacteria bacterium]|jgi:CarD family transcriptional regulator